MVDFIRLQETIKHKLDADRSIKNIEATAPTLKEAVTQAAALLNIPISKMEYQVSEKGANGFLGFGRKAWTIRAYPSQNILVQGMELEDDGLSLDSGFGFDTSTLNSQDGDCFVRLWSDGVYLKVTPPIGNGREVSTKDALNALEERNQQDYDKELVGRIAQESEGIYIKVGVFQANEAVNAGVQISVIDQDMKATATLSSPGPNGC
ncbi:MAG: Jag N-terminal domain-containing protein, partial [Spirochaetaceae bacterium]|nr:Jag N-terminal domain-containing protein [Spirochaetaceae bacterium]